MTTRDKQGKTRSKARPLPATTLVALAGPSGDSTQLERHQQRRLENECKQFLRVQQKLTGRKTTAEYARIRLVHRQDDTMRKRHLHENTPKRTERTGGPLTPKHVLKDDAIAKAGDGRRPLTARETVRHEPVPAATRARPQSAKPAHRTNALAHTQNGVAGQCVNVALLERCYYNPIPLTTYLATSRSAPRLQAALRYSTTPTSTARRGRERLQEEEIEDHGGLVLSPTVRHATEADDTSRRLRIVVNMRHLEIREDEDNESTSASHAHAASTPLSGQRHERNPCDAPHQLIPRGRSAWEEVD